VTWAWAGRGRGQREPTACFWFSCGVDSLRLRFGYFVGSGLWWGRVLQHDCLELPPEKAHVGVLIFADSAKKRYV
jgi:hypothetical protein